MMVTFFGVYRGSERRRRVTEACGGCSLVTGEAERSGSAPRRGNSLPAGELLAPKERLAGLLTGGTQRQNFGSSISVAM